MESDQQQEVRQTFSQRWNIANVTIAVVTSFISGTTASYITLQVSQATQAEKILALEKANITILESIRMITAIQQGCQEKTTRLEARQETVFWALTDIKTVIKENQQLLLEHEKETRRQK